MSKDWVFDGGRPCLDLVNTVRDRVTGRRELLTDARAFGDWLVAAGLVAHRSRVTHADLVGARELRTAVDDLLTADEPARSSVLVVNRFARAARPPVPQLAPDGRTARSRTGSVAGVLAGIALDAIELATSGVAVRECAAHDCGLRFADLSPKRNRQWCSMARCGNRAKARAHYAKVRDA